MHSLTKTQSKKYSKWVLKQMAKNTKDEMMKMKMTKWDHLRFNNYLMVKKSY